MDGVRKWIGSGSSASRRKARIESRQNMRSKSLKREDSSKDPKSTEEMAHRNLNPVVPENEEAEYLGYDSIRDLIRECLR